MIAEIAHDAESREARHDARAHHGKTLEALIEESLSELRPAVAALGKLPSDEAHEVGAWLVDIARAVGGAAKGVSANEQATIDKIAALFGMSGGDAAPV